MCISNSGTRRPYPVSVIHAFHQKQQQVNVQQETRLHHQRSVSPDDATSAAAAAALGDASTSSSSTSGIPVAHKAQHDRITVVHNYHDHANDYQTDFVDEHPVRGGVTTPFPIMLHIMLKTVEAEGMSDIISWQPHGRCFLVHKPQDFVSLLPRFFKLSKLASFQRQLNLYGFQRLTRGNDRSGYYHELFLRNRVFLAHNIQRIKIKGTGVRGRSNPDQEPDFWQNLPWVTAMPTLEKAQQSRSPAMKNDHKNELFPQSDFNLLSQLPLNLAIQQEQDDVLDAFEKPFHYLNPFGPSAGNWTLNGVDALMEREAEAFFDDFEFDQDAVNQADVEDDSVFGDLLEQMIA